MATSRKSVARTKTVAKSRAPTKARAKVAGKTPSDRKRVKLSLKADDGAHIFVAGTFNDWSETKNPLKRAEGTYTTSILLQKGRYEYKFIVDGVWTVDPECAEWVPNEHGSLNSVLIVK